MKVMLVRPHMTNLKMTIRVDSTVSAWRLLPQSMKESHPRLPMGGRGLWTDVSPNPQLPASEIKQTFLSTNLAHLLTSEQQAAGTHTFW